jgi:hypothetical protein
VSFGLLGFARSLAVAFVSWALARWLLADTSRPVGSALGMRCNGRGAVRPRQGEAAVECKR